MKMACPSLFYDSSGLARLAEHGSSLPVSVFEASSDAHLMAAARLRLRTFYKLRRTFRMEEHQRYLANLEFEALKEKVEGKRPGYGNVSCVIATTFSANIGILYDEVMSFYKIDGLCDEVFGDQLVVGSLDLNQTAKLPDEVIGNLPQGEEAHHQRGYLSNVCVARELQRRGIGSTLIEHTKQLARLRGIKHLYTHVAANNTTAENLYQKSGFIIETEEKASDARLMGRDRHRLLHIDLRVSE